MKFIKEKKAAIFRYILEKIQQGDGSLSKTVSETFGVNQNTIHTYINELVRDGVIARLKRGQYQLITHRYDYSLTRAAGDLRTDTYAYETCLVGHLQDYAANVRDIWAYSSSEMISNVMDHSGAENVHILVLQNYLTTSVYIVDDGVGIFKKIQDYFQLASPDEAIEELFKGKLTTDTKNHSGEGIFFCSRIMDRFVILSGGKAFSTDRYNNDLTQDLPGDTSRGTCVFMSLSNFTQKRTKDVFDQCADANGRFVKTRIPLKSLFDASPVSRSQAKRVCYRLDGFQTVELDFADIDWMGQGFAHQVFVVFQRNHPGTKLVPRNMNDAVTKMYNHVLTGDENSSY